MKPYQKVGDGDTISPTMNRTYKMMCCDCGLVHKLRFKVVRVTGRKKGGYWWGVPAKGHKVVFRAWRDNRATALTRRQRKREIVW